MPFPADRYVPVLDHDEVVVVLGDAEFSSPLPRSFAHEGFTCCRVLYQVSDHVHECKRCGTTWMYALGKGWENVGRIRE